MHANDADLCQAAEQRRPRYPEPRELLRRLHSVEERHNGGALFGDPSHDGRDVSEGIALDGEDGELRGPELLDAVRRGHARPKRSILGHPNLEAALANRREARASGEAGNLMSHARELSAVVGSDRAGAEHHDLHRAPRA